MNVENVNTKTLDWAPLRTTLDAAKNVVVVGHIRPDGDVVGSLIAMKRALTALGKNVVLVNGHAVPPSLKFVDPENEIRVLSQLTEQERAFVDNADVVVSCDVSSWAQLGPDSSELFKSGKSVKVVIDHHAVADQIGDLRFVDPNADSAGSIVFDAIKALGVPFTHEIAFPLFVAISSDTGWFRFASTSADTMRRAAELIDAGVDVAESYRLQNEQESFGRYKLLGAVASNCQRFLNGKGVFMALSQQDFERAGAIPSDSEDLVNTPLSVAGTEVAVIAVEQKDGSIKASFRSRCDLDCAKLAREFGGGGHARAAGASPKGDLETACKALMEKTTEYYDALQK